MKHMKLWRGLVSVLTTLVLAFTLLGDYALNNASYVNNYLGITTNRIIQEDGGDTDTSYYKSDYGELNDENLEKLIADEYAFCVEEMEEGAVLLKNEDVSLPLQDGERNVTLFGHATVAPLYRGATGGPDTTTEDAVDNLITFRDALETEGFQINPTLWDAYSESDTVRDTGTADIGEEPISFYTDDIRESFADYSDVAIVMLAREGGEFTDLVTSDADDVSQLALHQDERDMLDMIESSGVFDKTIVVLNCPYAMELGWLDEYDIDACLWIGGPGLRGFEGVANLLVGKANPSGRLVDTHAANSMSSPAVQNMGDFSYTNADEVAEYCSDRDEFVIHYVTYAEGIYTGYKYYETRYEDCVLGQGNADGDAGMYASSGSGWNYADEVVFPFGYGLSYTTFSQTLDEVEVGEDTVTAKVTVKNTGDTAGKSVAELYAQTPYTDYDREYDVEKSSIQLCGFAKTDNLEPGEEQQLTITVDKYLLASYDANGAEGYIMDAGDYYFALGDDAHDALNNVLAAKGAGNLVDETGASVSGDKGKTYQWTLEELDTTSFRYSAATGEEVTNQFENADLNTWIPDGVTYLTREDWQGTFPEPVEITATEEMMEEIDGHFYEKPEDAPSVSDFTQGADNGLTLVDMKDVSYDDDETWDKFLDQLTLEEMASILDDNTGTDEVLAVNKPAQINNDGPDGVRGNYLYGDKREATCYVNEVVAASTWNTDLLTRLGNFIAEDCLYTGLTQLWSPGADLHRTPFGGRNFEYFSEDSVQTYLYVACEVRAMTDKGVNVAIKHLAGNDQELYRYGLATFMTEQTWRQNNLKAFESAFTQGGALSTMTAFNRLGITYVGHSPELMKQVLRNEWGFQGVNITDARFAAEYMHTAECLASGTDMFCMSCMSDGEDFFNTVPIADMAVSQIQETDDGYLLQCLRDVNKHFYYAMAHSNLINDLSSDAQIVRVTPLWEKLIYGGRWVCIAALVVCAAMLIRSLYCNRKK